MDRVFIDLINIWWDNEIVLNKGININSTLYYIIEVFGEPYRTLTPVNGDTTLMYFFGFDFPNINFIFIGDKLIRVSFSLSFVY